VKVLDKRAAYLQALCVLRIGSDLSWATIQH